ncbi:unnamed protein product, partial [Pylaiella littoralis]
MAAGGGGVVVGGAASGGAAGRAARLVAREWANVEADAALEERAMEIRARRTQRFVGLAITRAREEAHEAYNRWHAAVQQAVAARQQAVRAAGDGGRDVPGRRAAVVEGEEDQEDE